MDKKEIKKAIKKDFKYYALSFINGALLGTAVIIFIN